MKVAPAGPGHWNVLLGQDEGSLKPHPLTVGRAVRCGLDPSFATLFVRDPPLDAVACLSVDGLGPTPLLCAIPNAAEYTLGIPTAGDVPSDARTRYVYFVFLRGFRGPTAVELERVLGAVQP